MGAKGRGKKGIGLGGEGVGGMEWVEDREGWCREGRVGGAHEGMFA